MVLEDGMQDDFGVQKVGAKNFIDGGEGAAEVFGHQVRRDAAGEGSAAILQGGGGLAEGVIVPDIGYKCSILPGNKVLLQ